MNLIIVFNKFNAAMAFNPKSGGKKLKSFISSVEENESRFGKPKYHFNRIRPNQKIIGNTFAINEEGFVNETYHSEILLVHLDNNINDWSAKFKDQFISYTSQFNQVYISYHSGVDREDIKNGNHEVIETLIHKKGSGLKKTEEYHHEYEMDGKEQLYGFLAKAIVTNKGYFNEDTYDEIIEKLISFFPPDEEIKETLILNKKLTFLHKLLGNEIEEAKKMYIFNITDDIETKLNSDDKVLAIKEIRDVLLKDFV